MEAVGVNILCPVCKTSHFLKNGTRNHNQRYRCKLCNTQFTPLSNTILEKTKWHWDIWDSLNRMQEVLEKVNGCIGIDHKTLFLWQHKLLHALAQMPQPKLSGVVQIDETFIRESQKGLRKLVSYISKKESLIDRITNKGFLDYAEFQDIKTDNSLNLGCVNELHSEIKDFICKTRTNVSTKYLGDYIGFFSYIHNWRIDNGHYPSSRSDAEKIFIEILRNQISYTTSDLKSAKVDLPKPTARYITLLKEKTKEARRVLKNQYFKFDEEDNVIDFDKRKSRCSCYTFIIHQLHYITIRKCFTSTN